MIVNTKDDEVSYATWKQINVNSDIEYILSFLPDREKRLIKDILDGYTFGEVSKKYKLSRYKIRQVLGSIKTKIEFDKKKLNLTKWFTINK